MKKLIGIITLITSVVIATALNLNYQAQKKEKLANSMAADRRFIDVAADAYFLEKKSEEVVTLEALVEWSIAESKNNWTRTLDPAATYNCELTRTHRRYEIYHPSLKEPMVWDN